METRIDGQGRASPAPRLAGLAGRLMLRGLGALHAFAGFYLLVRLLVQTVRAASLREPIGPDEFGLLLLAIVAGGPFGVALIVLGLALYQGRPWAYAPAALIGAGVVLAQAIGALVPGWPEAARLAWLGGVPLLALLTLVVALVIGPREGQ